jgi:hypothetical protein
VAYHPDVEAILARGQQLGDSLAKLEAALFSDLRVRRSAPREPNLLPEIDGYGALTDLWMDGIVGRYSAPEIERLFLDALGECYGALGDRRSEAAYAVVDEDLLAAVSDVSDEQMWGKRP